MKFKVIQYLLGRLFCVIGLCMLLPLVVALIYGEDKSHFAFLISSVSTFLLGVSLIVLNYKHKDDPIAARDGFLLVTLTWFLASALGAIPYTITQTFPSFIDAFFESVSGFTTTGATVLSDIEALPKSVLIWRSMSQWIGGLGIIVLAVAILPQLSVGGLQLMKNEMPGPTFEQLKPRIKQTALSLWKIYILFSVILIFIFKGLGMDWFDSVCHMFTTVASGGFSTKNASMAHFGTPIQLVTILFMFLAGINFVIHYAWLHGDFRRPFKDSELKFFVHFVVLAIVFISINIIFQGEFILYESLIAVVFQVVSLATSTGFTTTDYNAWPYFSKGILFLLMFVGGCAGSTSGGFKQLRLQLLLLKTKSTLIKQIFPKVVTSVKVGKKPMPEEILNSVGNLFLVSVVVFSGCTVILLAFNIEFVTSTAAVVACLSNMGPGLGMVGPATNYGWMPDAVKLLLSVCMVVGRLEFLTVLVLFLPMAWKR